MHHPHSQPSHVGPFLALIRRIAKHSRIAFASLPSLLIARWQHGARRANTMWRQRHPRRVDSPPRGNLDGDVKDNLRAMTAAGESQTTATGVHRRPAFLLPRLAVALVIVVLVCVALSAHSAFSSPFVQRICHRLSAPSGTHRSALSSAMNGGDVLDDQPRAADDLDSRPFAMAADSSGSGGTTDRNDHRSRGDNGDAEDRSARDASRMHVRLIVLTFDRAASLSRCLQSLRAADYGGDDVSLDIHVDHPFAGVQLNDPLQLKDRLDSRSWEVGEQADDSEQAESAAEGGLGGGGARNQGLEANPQLPGGAKRGFASPGAVGLGHSAFGVEEAGDLSNWRHRGRLWAQRAQRTKGEAQGRRRLGEVRPVVGAVQRRGAGEVASKRQKFRSVLAVADSFPWQHGHKQVHVRSMNGGVQAQWMEAWWPSDSNEFAFVLEDDVAVSPLFYAYLKRMLLRYYYNHTEYDSNVYGISLQRQRLVPGQPARAIAHTGRPFLYSLVGTWGQLLLPAPWRAFRVWYDARRYTPGREPGNGIWTPWIVRWAHATAALNLYASLPGGLALSVSHREQGESFKRSQGADATLLMPEHLAAGEHLGAAEQVNAGGLLNATEHLPEHLRAGQVVAAEQGPWWWRELPPLASLPRFDFCLRPLPWTGGGRGEAEAGGDHQEGRAGAGDESEGGDAESAGAAGMADDTYASMVTRDEELLRAVQSARRVTSLALLLLPDLQLSPTDPSTPPQQHHAHINPWASSLLRHTDNPPPPAWHQLARNWACHVDGLGLSHYAVLTSCPALALHLATRGHLVSLLPSSPSPPSPDPPSPLPPPLIPSPTHLRTAVLLSARLRVPVLLASPAVTWRGDPFLCLLPHLLHAHHSSQQQQGDGQAQGQWQWVGDGDSSDSGFDTGDSSRQEDARSWEALRAAWLDAGNSAARWAALEEAARKLRVGVTVWRLGLPCYMAPSEVNSSFESQGVQQGAWMVAGGRGKTAEEAVVGMKGAGLWELDSVDYVYST
ncbi:unnamed protein product [Closterium sp. Yama58-4]|nr:unnamed protein product [Closterium sp. Yama58-4]